MNHCSDQGRDVVTMVTYRTRNAGYFITKRDTVSVSCMTVLRGDNYKVCGLLNKVWWRKCSFCSIDSSDLFDNRIDRDQWRSCEAKLYTGHVTVCLMCIGLFSINFTFDDVNTLSFSVLGKFISSAKFQLVICCTAELNFKLKDFHGNHLKWPEIPHRYSLYCFDFDTGLVWTN